MRRRVARMSVALVKKKMVEEASKHFIENYRIAKHVIGGKNQGERCNTRAK